MRRDIICPWVTLSWVHSTKFKQRYLFLRFFPYWSRPRTRLRSQSCAFLQITQCTPHMHLKHAALTTPSVTPGPPQLTLHPPVTCRLVSSLRALGCKPARPRRCASAWFSHHANASSLAPIPRPSEGTSGTWRHWRRGGHGPHGGGTRTCRLRKGCLVG
jgi:hypothetical protein